MLWILGFCKLTLQLLRPSTSDFKASNLSSNCLGLKFIIRFNEAMRENNNSNARRAVCAVQLLEYCSAIGRQRSISFLLKNGQRRSMFAPLTHFWSSTAGSSQLSGGPACQRDCKIRVSTGCLVIGSVRYSSARYKLRSCSRWPHEKFQILDIQLVPH